MLPRLVETLKHIQAAAVLCCYEIRDIGEAKNAQEKFFELIPPAFDVEGIPWTELDPDYRSSDIRLLFLVKKSVGVP